jgi:hypothetical protein
LEWQFCHGWWKWEIENERSNKWIGKSHFLLKVNLESEELPIDEGMQLVGEEIVDAEYKMVELMHMAWGGEIHLGLDLNEELLEGNDVDDQPTTIVMHLEAHE